MLALSSAISAFQALALTWASIADLHPTLSSNKSSLSRHLRNEQGTGHTQFIKQIFIVSLENTTLRTIFNK